MCPIHQPWSTEQGHKDNFKPDFNPHEVATPHCEATIETMLDKILNLCVKDAKAHLKQSRQH